MFCGADEGNPQPQRADDCKKIENYIYKMSEKVGEGNFSQVFHGVDSNTGKSVAIKVVKYSSLSSRVAEQLLKNEVAILKELDHPNVLKCLDILSSKNNCYIISEFYDGGDLEKILYRNKIFQEKDISKIVYEVYKGLVYLNEQGIVHRDFKLANVFMDSSGIPKIADFGFAVKANAPFKDINIGSPIYMSPEGMLLHEYGPKTEVWAFGVMIYELLHGDTPLSACRSEKELKQKIMLPPHFREGISPECRKFIDLCLTVDPKHRIRMKDLMQTPYMSRLCYENERVRVVSNPQFFPKPLGGKEDLSSTFHSTVTMNAPDHKTNPNEFLKCIKSYEQGVAVLQYCRLVHKTTQLITSNLLSQWLLSICSGIQKLKLQGGDRERNQKLIETIHNYFNKYRKQHPELTGHPRASEVLKELEQLIERTKQSPPPNNPMNRPGDQPSNKLALLHNHLLFLAKQTQLLQKALHTQPIKLSLFVKFTQVQKYLEWMKQASKMNEFSSHK